jgi:uncharacterized protein
MRGWLSMLAALALWALGGAAASAQTPLDCSVVPQSICENEEILALEGERAALVERLASADPQNAALASEQTWLDGLSACGEDADCYRTAYLNHTQTLRQSVAALPGATAEPPLEAPPDAETIETPPPESATPPRAERAERGNDARERGGQVYVPGGLPGWGFFTAIGVTLLIFYWLLRTRAKHLREVRADEARLRDDWG